MYFDFSTTVLEYTYKIRPPIIQKIIPKAIDPPCKVVPLLRFKIFPVDNSNTAKVKDNIPTTESTVYKAQPFSDFIMSLNFWW